MKPGGDKPMVAALMAVLAILATTALTEGPRLLAPGLPSAALAQPAWSDLPLGRCVCRGLAGVLTLWIVLRVARLRAAAGGFGCVVGAVLASCLAGWVDVAFRIEPALILAWVPGSVVVGLVAARLLRERGLVSLVAGGLVVTLPIVVQRRQALAATSEITTLVALREALLGLAQQRVYVATKESLPKAQERDLLWSLRPPHAHDAVDVFRVEPGGVEEQTLRALGHGGARLAGPEVEPLAPAPAPTSRPGAEPWRITLPAGGVPRAEVGNREGKFALRWFTPFGSVSATVPAVDGVVTFASDSAAQELAQRCAAEAPEWVTYLVVVEQVGGIAHAQVLLGRQ